MEINTFPVGTLSNWQITLKDATGTVVTSYTIGDVLSASFWAGDDQAVLFSPAVSWADAPNGLVNLSFAAANTASLATGRYWCRVSINTTTDAWTGLFDLTSSPGTATPKSTYCSYNDLLLYAPWLQKEQTDQDQAGFVEERHQARIWLENIIQRRYSNQAYTAYMVLGQYTAFPLGYDGNSLWLQQQLDANYLMTSDPHPVKEINAKYAIGLVCRSAIGPGSDKSGYQRLAAQYLLDANEMVKSYVAQLDLNADGYPDVIIHCGSPSFRKGWHGW